MSDLILKGKGVYYRDGDGKMHLQTFPPPDSDHEEHTHFHINSKTGKLFEELLSADKRHLVGKFPMEIAAGIMARELMSDGYTDSQGI